VGPSPSSAPQASASSERAASAPHYPAVDPAADFGALEREVLAYWREQRIFSASIEARAGARDFVFYDGPPFANGLPHYGHLLTGYVKDIVPRYQTMRGRRVERRFGWDCHGLPAEMEAEKQLELSGRAQILEYGMQRFNEHCKTSVLRYAGEWERYVTRQARWVDFERDYKTMDLSFMESVMWAFKRLHEKGLIYEGFRVMPYSWAAETPVSNFETRIDNSYRERQDPAATVRFTLEPRPGDAGPIALLAWTTTPWTLPSNLALAVAPELEYALYERGGAEGTERWILASSAAARYEKELAGFERRASFPGRELVGRAYTPLFPFFAQHPRAFRVLAGDFVSAEDGTGVVHMAPGFGEDDQRVCAEHGIEPVIPVDSRGRFTEAVPDWNGMNVFTANKPILQRLKALGVLVRHETIVHNYPHCWRTDEPLIYKAMSSWYVQVTALRERMLELNREIRWIPGTIQDGQFGKWLEGARDWSISRNRFFGSPIPVWRSDDPRYPRIDVYGSLDELERDFGVRPSDLHRPGIDQLTRPNPDDPSGESTMRRVEDVLDCWFESGSMPFAQVHYPFENKEWFEHHFPADFIVEYVAQTRGWFYTLMVLGTALFDKPPFRACMCHGVVLDENGQKLSKRLRNYPSPEEVFEKDGADALRWFLVSSPILRGADLQIDREGKGITEVVRLVLKPIWNAWAFFALYANADGLRGAWRTDQQGLLDRYLLAKARLLVEGVTQDLDAYEIAGACARVRAFVDALNNWWIRRSRERFWSAADSASASELAAKRDACDTLYTVLHVLCRVCAPLLPLLSEAVYRGLTGERSVHLADWPDAAQLPSDERLVVSMDRAREVCSAALALRDERKLRVRLPLASLTIAGAAAQELEPLGDLVREEVNVKRVELSARLEDYGSFELALNSRALGPRLGGEMKRALAAAKAGRWTRGASGAIEVDGLALSEGEYTLRLVPRAGAQLAIAGLPSSDMLVVLETALTPELEREGSARDLVRAIQQARKDAGLRVGERIALWLALTPALEDAARAHAPWIAEQTLARALEFDAPPSGARVQEVDVEGERVRIALEVRSNAR
jgi:isoleucyl-tRNA synthetase